MRHLPCAQAVNSNLSSVWDAGKEINMRKKVAFHTLGCRVNTYETEAMTEQLRGEGYEIVPFDECADIYIINTCTVTNIADRKSRQMLHRAREMNPAAVVVAAGCYAEGASGKLMEDAAVDLVVGNQDKIRLAEILREYDAGVPAALPQVPIGRVKEYAPLSISETEGRTRAFLKIQDGCNQFCTYCMIPYVRGRVRSRDPEDIVQEAARLAEAGYSEIVLTGIHISSYGLDFDFPGENRQTPFADRAETNRHLLQLARRTAGVPGVRRLRFGSLEPGIMTEEFVKALAELPETCPQFHLSLQSGCDATLARMNRRYDTASYAAICDRLRTAFDRPAITTDIIVGFPGETDEEFSETLAFARKIGFSKMHIFKYSKRDGTKAASMKNQVSEQARKRRSEVLLDLDREMRLSYALLFRGAETEVLFEERKTENGITYESGHTPEALDAYCVSGEDLSGRIVRCKVRDIRDDGTLLCEDIFPA